MRSPAFSPVPTAVLAALGLILTTQAPLLAQTGVVAGTVTNAQTGAPIPAAQVFVLDTQLGGLTNSAGQYRIAGVSPGQRQVRVLVMGFRSETAPVIVAAGDTARVDFQLVVQAIALDEILITGTAGRQERRAQAASVASVQASAVNEVSPVASVATLLQARTPGVSVSLSSGVSGSSQRIRLRGSASINLSNDPLLFVDGIRADARTNYIMYTGGPAPSRLNDINPDDIESIEVVKGPAAANLYGADASGGVIQIRTKRGGVGSGFTQTLSIEQGVLDSAWEPPDNWGVCTAAMVSDPKRTLCYGQAAGTVVSDNPIERYDVLQPGSQRSLAWSGRGGGQGYGYYLSLAAEKEQGLLENNSYARYTGRVNFDFSPRDDLRMEWSMGLGRILTELPDNESSQYGYFRGALGGSPVTVGLAQDGWAYANRQVEAISAIRTRDHALKVTPGLTVHFAPWPWLRHRLSLGADVTRTDARRFYPKNDQVWYPTATLNSGAVFQALDDYDRLTFDYLASARRYLPSDVVADLALGAQFVSTRSRLLYGEGRGLTTNSAAGVSSGSQRAADSRYTEQREGGLLAQLDLAWRERVYLQLGGRLDRNSAFGADAPAFFNPKVGMSWVLSEEGFYPEALREAVPTLRTRAVWGSTGRSPRPGAGLTTYASSPVALSATVVEPGVRPLNPGNEALRAERGEELEFGLDAAFLGERVGLEVTRYDKRSKDLILQRPVPLSLGFTENPFANIGEMRNQGWEVALDATLFDRSPVRWEARATLSTNRNEVVDMGGLPDIGQSWRRVIPGYPAYGFWNYAVRSVDVANDRVIVSDTMEQFIGGTDPRREGSVSSTITLFDALRVYAQIDFQQDYVVYNTNGWAREVGLGVGERWVRRYEILSDEERLRRFGPFVTESGTSLTPYDVDPEYMQDGSHVRFRELSVGYTVPARWARRIGAASAAVTLSGRNLALWTDYEGHDPEAVQVPDSDTSGSSQFSRFDYLSLPQPRRWTARLSLTF